MRSAARLHERFGDRRFTADDVLRLQDEGLLGEDDRFELVEGEIVPMQAKTHRHELIKSAVGVALARVLPDPLWIGFESTMYLSDDILLEPDLVIYPRGMRLEAVKGRDIVLAIEVAVSTLGYDLGRKARLYARHGVRELWVIDAERLRTHLHRDPVEETWRSVTIRAAGEPLTHPALPGFTMSLPSP